MSVVIPAETEVDHLLSERNIQVLVASSLRVVGEAIQAELNQIENVNATCTTGLNIELLTEIEAVEADVVVLLDENGKVPGVVSHVFDNFPGIVVVVFNPKKNQAILCQRTISQEAISQTNLTDLIQRISERESFNYWGVGHEQTN